MFVYKHWASYFHIAMATLQIYKWNRNSMEWPIDMFIVLVFILTLTLIFFFAPLYWRKAKKIEIEHKKADYMCVSSDNNKRIFSVRTCINDTHDWSGEYCLFCYLFDLCKKNYFVKFHGQVLANVNNFKQRWIKYFFSCSHPLCVTLHYFDDEISYVPSDPRVHPIESSW